MTVMAWWVEKCLEKLSTGDNAKQPSLKFWEQLWKVVYGKRLGYIMNKNLLTIWRIFKHFFVFWLLTDEHYHHVKTGTVLENTVLLMHIKRKNY